MNLPQAAFCANCSAPLGPAPAATATPNQQQWQAPGGPVVQQMPASGGGASQKAIMALVLAIAAFFCCGFITGVPAAIVGWMELNAIKRGESSPAGSWMAQVGLWLGIGASILHLIIGVIYFILVLASGMR
jgi:hypothetical protein